jgi:hypothetical protein
VVEAAGELELLIVRTDAFAELGGSGEIHGRALHGPDFAGGDERCIDGGKAIGVDGEDMGSDVTPVVPSKVEICVCGEVGDSRLVGRNRVVIDAEFIRIREAIDDPQRHPYLDNSPRHP